MHRYVGAGAGNSNSPNGPIGFAQGVILATYDPAVFTSYDLATALGPIVTGCAVGASARGVGGMAQRIALMTLVVDEYDKAIAYYANTLGSTPVEGAS